MLFSKIQQMSDFFGIPKILGMNSYVLWSKDPLFPNGSKLINPIVGVYIPNIRIPHILYGDYIGYPNIRIPQEKDSPFLIQYKDHPTVG